MDTIWKQRVSLRFCVEPWVLLVWRSIFTLTNTSSFSLFRFEGSKASASIDLKAIDSNCSFKSTSLLSLCPASKDLPQPWRSLLFDLCLDLEFPAPRTSVVCDTLLLNGWVSGNLGTQIHMRDNFLWFFKNILDQSEGTAYTCCYCWCSFWFHEHPYFNPLLTAQIVTVFQQSVNWFLKQ